MGITSLAPETQQRLAVLVPVVALAVSVFVVYPGWKTYRETLAKTDEQQQRLTTLKNTPMPLPAAVLPAVPESPSEPPEFLAGIRQLAQETGCLLVGFDLTLPPAPVSGEKELAQGGNEEKPKEPPSPVTPMRAKIEVEGTYASISELVARLLKAPRLYAIAGVEVGTPQVNKGTDVRATVEIERYLVKDAPAALPPPAAG